MSQYPPGQEAIIEDATSWRSGVSELTIAKKLARLLELTEAGAVTPETLKTIDDRNSERLTRKELELMHSLMLPLQGEAHRSRLGSTAPENLRFNESWKQWKTTRTCEHTSEGPNWAMLPAGGCNSCLREFVLKRGLYPGSAYDYKC